MRTAVNISAVVALLALIAVSIAWELWIAPLRPTGSWLVLKAVPLLLPLRGILHGKRYTFQWSSMFILIYMAEGIVRGFSESGASRNMALAEIVLSCAYFLAAITYTRMLPRT